MIASSSSDSRMDKPLLHVMVDHGDSTITTTTEASTVTVQDDEDNDDNKHEDNNQHHHYSWCTIPYTTSLPLLVMLDMLGVSLVVPLLHSQYFQRAGVTSANQREWLSSIFSASQIVGGLMMGALADSGSISNHSILILSFGGSALAYLLLSIEGGGLPAIVVSRVIVGLVKQTMTITSSILSHATAQNERATHMGRLHASVTVAWIVGPSAGAYLFHNVGIYTPIYVACGLFLLNTLIVLVCLPKEETQDNTNNNHDKTKETTDINKGKPHQKQQSTIQRMISNFQECFQSNNACLASVVSALLLFQWVQKTTSYKTIATYYETRYGMEPHQRGYLQSYLSLWAFVVQSWLVRPLLKLLGGEINGACSAALVMAVATVAEFQVDLTHYLLWVCPLMATATAILGVTLKSIVSQVAPKQSLGSVFATIDVLSNAVQVTVPFYRTLLFSMTQPQPTETNTTGGGDPDPYQWLLASGLHWLVATFAIAYLLLVGSPCASTMDKGYDNNGGKENDNSAGKENGHESATSKVKTS